MSDANYLIARPKQPIIVTLIRAVLWLFLVITVYLVGVVGLVRMQSTIDQTQPADAAIVLGAAVWAGSPSPVLSARLAHALDLFQKKQVNYIIVTGGTGTGDDLSEAEAGARFLIENGVPAANILLEREGRSTYQSMQAAALLAAPLRLQRVLLVSDPFHMLRSLKMAQDLGFEAYASPTKTSPISSRPVEEWLYMIREAVAYTTYVFGWQ
ncbi:MAG: hypothetical protein RLY87_130 [Chloroflexota bacterium]|jgi:uncharacterized SAM-binding protein YcdF (DUF218 family)